MTDSQITSSKTTTSKTLNRRTVAAGLTWTVPTIAAAVAAPAYAASTTTLTATNVTPQIYQGRYYRVDSRCTYNGGFLDTQGVTPSNGAYNGSTPIGDGLRSTSSSIGYWLETSNTTSGTARIDAVTTVYTFNNPIIIDQCPTGGYNTTGTWRWTQCTTLNGWSYSLSADRKTLTLTWNKPTIVNTSTSALRSGDYLPGFFINYHVAGSCSVATNTTVTTNTTMTYSTKTNPGGTTTTKNIPARRII